MSAKKCEQAPPSARAVLIADDNQDDVYLLLRDLQQMGVSHPIRAVSNGEEVLAYLKGDGLYDDRDKFPYPILLVLDLRMEPEDGFAVMRWLKANPRYKTFPILVVTALADRQAMTEAYRLGAATFLTKPFTQGALVEAFQELNVLPKRPE
jgi:CheY-like chemotaxis protein